MQPITPTGRTTRSSAPPWSNSRRNTRQTQKGYAWRKRTMPKFEYYDERERTLVEQYITTLRGYVAATIEYGKVAPNGPISSKVADANQALRRYYTDKYTCTNPQT